jgi:DNA repair protein RecO (recombination protein O)
VPLYRDEAIVLRTHKLGEADRIVTVLSRRLGKLRVVGKGVRRTRSRFGARLEPGMHIDVQCYEGRSLDTVTQVETVDPWGEVIARDYRAWTAATAVLETCDRLTEEREPALQQYLLLSGALRSLAQRDHVAAGGAVCPVCRPPGSAAPSPDTLRLLAALLAGDWVLADGSEDRHRREGSGLTAAFLQWHLERGIRSLRMVER